MYFILDADGRTPIPCQYWEWVHFFENENRLLAEDRIGPYLISTYFVGMNERILPGRPPLIFESTLFINDTSFCEAKYSTYEQAMAGHKSACEVAMSKVN